MPGEMPALPVVLMLGVTELSLLVGLRTVEAFVAFFSFFFAGFLINTLTDYDIDKTYGTFKSNMPLAVDAIGKKNLMRLVVFQIVLAIMLSLHISLWIGSYVPLAIMLMGAFTGLGYSLKPFKFKERGVLSALSLSFCGFFLPPTFLVYSVRGSISFPVLVLFTGFAIAHYGLEFGNQAIDYQEDVKHRILTPPVRWGLTRSLKIGLWTLASGVVLELVGLYMMFMEKGGSINPSLLLPLYVLGGFFIIIGYRGSMANYKSMITATERLPLAPATEELRKLCKYSKWQIAGILGVLLAVTVFFLAPFFPGA